jgi:hypothetical protein
MNITSLAPTHPAVPFYYTDVILQHYQPFFQSSSSFQIRIFNLHEAAVRNMSLLTLFLCDTLPFSSSRNDINHHDDMSKDDAPLLASSSSSSSLISCRYSRRRDAQHVAQQQQQQQQQGKNHTGGGHRMANQHDDAMLLMTYYDAIATAAVATGLVNATRIQRRQVVLACKDFDESLNHQHHQQQQQQQEQSALPSSLSFPLICPTHAQYKAFLDLSLQKEREILSFLAPTTTTSPPSFLERMQQEHRQAFYKAAVLDKKFCWIDTNRVLQNETWKGFLTGLTTATPPPPLLSS